MFESKINRGRANGYAPLGSSGKVPLDYLPPIQSTLNTGSFATTGSNTFTGVQTLAGTSGTAWAELTIGQTNIFGNYNSYDIRATGSSDVGISLTSDVLSIVGVIDTEFGPAGNNSIVFNGKYGFPYSDGPFTGIGVLKSGSQEKVWIYDYAGKSSFPGDVNIGYNSFFAGEYSGSLNVNKGNINVSGSINTTGSLNIISGSLNVKGNSSFTGNINLSGSLNISSSMIISSTVVNNGNFEALNSDLIIDGGDIILSGSQYISGSLNVDGNLSIGGYSSTGVSTIIQNNIEEGVFINKEDTSLSYGAYNGGAEFTLSWEYQKPLTTGSGISVLAVQFPDASIQTTAFLNDVIKLTPVVTFPTGQAGMLVASASYGKTNLYMYDGSDWKWLVTGSIA
jgi:hypothetical protein